MSAECLDNTYSTNQEWEYSPPYYDSDECQHIRIGECVVWSQCLHPEFFTRYCLKRVWPARHGIVLEVSRDLFSGPTHPAWLAQMEQKGAEAEVKGDMVDMLKYKALIEIEPINSQLCNGNLPKIKTNNKGNKTNE
jgi:hypothetical protein